MALQWVQADDDTVTAEQDGTTWVLQRRLAPDDHPRVGRCWYLHLTLEGGLTVERLPMSHDLARAKREAEVTISYDANNVRALLGTKVETSDDSNSSRLNQLSVERLRERFGDTPLPELPAEILNARVRFWMCINRDHKSVVWDDDVARCPDCGVTSDMTTRYAETIRKFERERIAKGFRQQADRYEEASKSADNLGGQWFGTAQAMQLRHAADCIEGQDLEQL